MVADRQTCHLLGYSILYMYIYLAMTTTNQIMIPFLFTLSGLEMEDMN
jgi:hypothetical protein